MYYDCCCCFRRGVQQCVCVNVIGAVIAQHVAGHLGVRLPATPATPGSPRRRRTLHHRGLEKLALNSGTTRGARKMVQNAKKKPSSHPTAESNLPLLRTGMSTKPSDELILRHFQLRDCVAAKSQGRPHLVDELQQQGHRPLCQSTATAGPSQFRALGNNRALHTTGV